MTDLDPDAIVVPRALLQALLDIAISSMDFGSGSLDNEEVAQLRHAAELLGVDPAVATPEGFRRTFLVPLNEKEREDMEQIRTWLAMGILRRHDMERPLGERERGWYQQKLTDLEARPLA